jgi:hypothetical protein
VVHKRNDFLVSSPLATELRNQLIPLANRSADWKLNIGEIEADLTLLDPAGGRLSLQA